MRCRAETDSGTSRGVSDEALPTFTMAIVFGRYSRRRGHGTVADDYCWLVGWLVGWAACRGCGGVVVCTWLLGTYNTHAHGDSHAQARALASGRPSRQRQADKLLEHDGRGGFHSQRPPGSTRYSHHL